MPRLELAPEVLDDFDRILDHLREHQVDDAIGRLGAIVDALGVLEHSPLIGRPVEAGLRELVIGGHSRGYVALYRFEARWDVVFILAVRSQREAGYSR